MSVEDLDLLSIYINARTTLIYIDTFEEARFLTDLYKQQDSLPKHERTIFVWSCTEGWRKVRYSNHIVDNEVVDSDAIDPFDALDFVLRDSDNEVPDLSLFIFKDFHPYVKPIDCA